MYSIKNFVEYENQAVNQSVIVLVWSKSTGYMFIPYSKFTPEFKIVGIEA